MQECTFMHKERHKGILIFAIKKKKLFLIYLTF